MKRFAPILFILAGYVFNAPDASAQRTSLATLEAAIIELQARLAAVEAGNFDANIEAAGDITAYGNIATAGDITAYGNIVTAGDISAGGGVQVGVSSSIANPATAGMLRWSPVLNKLEVSDGTAWSPLSPVVGPQKVQRDFISWGTVAPGTQPVYIKTNIRDGSNVMYRIAVEGYAYQSSQIINSVAAGYAYSAVPGTIVMQTTANYSPGATISQYISNDGFVVIKLQPTNTYFMGFSASAWFTNPAGEGFQISAVVLHGVPAP